VEFLAMTASHAVPWPTVRRRAFTDDDSVRTGRNAQVAWAVQHGMDGYIHGYANAARAVYETATRNRESPEYTVWPLVYLWRHHLELALKAIIQLDGSKPEHMHNLVILWTKAKPLIQACGGDEPEVSIVEEILLELQAVDPRADGWRYPTTGKDGAPSFKRGPEEVNLFRLQQAMEEVSTYLDCVLTEMRHRAGLL
jgi:hypothetical protein